MLPVARLVTFLVGVTPRAVLGAIGPGGTSLMAGTHLSFASPQRVVLSGSAHALYDELLVRLRGANAALCALTRAPDGSVNVEALMDATCDWEGAVKALEWREVEAAWAACAERRGLAFARDGPFLARIVGDLADAHLVHLELAPGGSVVRLWPPAAALVAAGAAAPQPPAFAERVAELLLPLAALVKEATVKTAVEAAARRLA